MEKEPYSRSIDRETAKHTANNCFFFVRHLVLDDGESETTEKNEENRTEGKKADAKDKTKRKNWYKSKITISVCAAQLRLTTTTEPIGPNRLYQCLN